jgi:preprotein translocase subunit YajC
MNTKEFQKGTRVITPNGEEGEVLDTYEDKVKVKLDNGEERDYNPEELEDDSAAG